METLFFYIIRAHKRSGILFLWWTPFYGVGVVLSLLVYKLISSRIKNRFWKNVLLLGILFVLLSLLELIGGIFIEKIYGYAMWDYGRIPLHIGKYISVPTSLLWVGISFLYIYVLKKWTDRILIRTPKFLTILFMLIFVLDVICSLLKLL